jgi:cytochrome c oxidase assembly factor CtaG
MPIQLPPELTPVRGLTEWSIDPYALALLVVACAAYLAGVRRLRRAGERWPVGRTIAFCAGGAGLAFIATSSFLSVYWPVLFYVRAFQTVVLLLAVPLFIMLGRPLSLVIAAAPRTGRRIEAAIAGRVARTLTFPAITGLALVLTPFVLYYSPWYAAGFDSFAVRELTSLVLVLPGLVFFWTLLRVDPVPRQYPYLVALWVTAAEVVGDAALGLSVIVDHNLIAGGYYHALARPWGPSVAADQVLGGGALWILGDLVGLPFLAAVLIAMIREDETEAKVIDAELDNAELPSPAVAEASPPGQMKPWWESDPRFAGRFAPVESKAPDQD